MSETDVKDATDLSADISPNGDVVLVVGPREARLRVTSQCLSSASKVFSAMFNSQWSEGQNLSEKAPKDIFLEEDDAMAMRRICFVIHHRNDLVERVVSPREVLDMAILADKYDLGIALTYAMAQWLRPKAMSNHFETAYIMAAAYLLQNEEVFTARSLSLLLYYKSTYLTIFEDTLLSEILPWQTACE